MDFFFNFGILSMSDLKINELINFNLNVKFCSLVYLLQWNCHMTWQILANGCEVAVE